MGVSKRAFDGGGLLWEPRELDNSALLGIPYTNSLLSFECPWRHRRPEDRGVRLRDTRSDGRLGTARKLALGNECEVGAHGNDLL